MISKSRLLMSLSISLMLLIFGISGNAYAGSDQNIIIPVFQSDDISFAPDDSSIAVAGDALRFDNGREIGRVVLIPTFTRPVRITAHLTINPIPKDDIIVHDKWDRAGNIRLVKDGMADIEVVKFITSYGGTDSHTVDVSHLAFLLKGECQFRAFIDTWVNPAWTVDLKLEFEEIPDSLQDSVYVDYIENPDWVTGVLFQPGFNHESHSANGIEREVTIPVGMKRVVLNYFVSGHCTDGNGADEFVPKDNVIYVDGRPVYRFQPWRDDCREFRENNPYTRRWSDGSWSSDYSRSGWCPGDFVLPHQIDLTDYLTPGVHTIKFTIENIRPKDDKGNYGYWRVSGHLIGWEEMVHTVKW